MAFYAVLAVAIAARLYILDAVLRIGLRLMAGYFPTDVAGPDGWLIDTRASSGVFDR